MGSIEGYEETADVRRRDYAPAFPKYSLDHTYGVLEGSCPDASRLALIQVSSAETDGSANYTLVDCASYGEQEVKGPVEGIALFNGDEGYGIATSKALKKNYRSVLRFLHFIGDTQMSEKELAKGFTNGQMRISVESHGISWYDAAKAKAGSQDIASTQFRKIRFSYDNVHVPRMSSEQLFHVRVGKLGATQRLFQKNGGPEFERLAIASGLCLFGTALINDIQALDNDAMKSDATRLDNIVNHKALHETDGISRLSSAIADVVCLINQGIVNAVNPVEAARLFPIQIKLDVARFQYYGVAMEMMQQEKWDASGAARWLDLVDERHDILYHAFSETIKHDLLDRGLNAKGVVEICVTEGSKAAEEAFRNSIVDRRQLPDLSACFDALQNDKSTEWAKFIETANESNKDLTIKDLSGLTYQYELLANILRGDGTAPRATIVIDDPMEWKIFDQSAKLVDKLNKQSSGGKNLLIGAYPHTRILCEVERDLFHYDCRRKFYASDSPMSSPDVSPSRSTFTDTIGLSDLAKRLSLHG